MFRFFTFHNNELQMDIDIKVKHKNIKLLEDYLGEILLNHPGSSEEVLHTWPKAQPRKEIIDRLDFINVTKNLYYVKDNVKRTSRQARDEEKICAKDTSDIGLLSKII